jgi:hypothetical protein
MTELERAQRPLFQVYALANLILAMAMGMIGFKWSPTSRYWNWCLRAGVAIFVLGWLGFAGVNYWWGSFMMNGAGG